MPKPKCDCGWFCRCHKAAEATIPNVPPYERMDKDLMERIDKDFRKYMADSHPEIEPAPPGKQWQPYYDVWIGKHWRDYPGFWDAAK